MRHPMTGHDGEEATALSPAISAPSRSCLPEPGPDAAPVAALLRDLLAALRGHRAHDAGVVRAAGGLGAAGIALLDQVLGQGEVSLIVTGACEYQVQESVLTGVWRVRTFDIAGQPVADHVEIADIPQVVRAAAASGTDAELPIGAAPDGAMNVMPVLAEIRSRMAADPAGTANHVISFSLLPMNDVDMTHLKQVLGVGPIQMMSRGYGSCRVVSTARRHVWSVQYLNAMDVVILDTLEIGDVPLSVCAADEDFEDSAIRLEQILEACFP